MTINGILKHGRWPLLAALLLILAACAQTTDEPPVDTDPQLTVEVVGDGAVTSVPAGIDCTGTEETCVATFESGTTVTLTAAEAAGANFVAWSGDACDTDANPVCEVTITEDMTVTATFQAESVPTDPQVSVAVVGGGTVVSTPEGIQCTGTEETCVATFEPGTAVTLTATEAAGFNFVNWTGDVCDAATETVCEFTVQEDVGVTANFDAEPGTEVLFEQAVAASAGDAEELVDPSLSNATNFPAGHTYVDSSDLELQFDPSHGTQVVGLLFPNVSIPANADVLEARIVFTGLGGSTGTLSVVIAGEANVAPSLFADDPNTTGSFDITTRGTTAATVQWDIAEEWLAGQAYSSADITSIVEEILALEGWASGNAMAFVIEGLDDLSEEFRRAGSLDGGAAPVLEILYTVPAA